MRQTLKLKRKRQAFDLAELSRSDATWKGFLILYIFFGLPVICSQFEMIGLENWTQFGKSKVLYCLFNVNFTNLITKNLDHFRSNPPSPPEQGLRHLVLTSLVYKLFRFTITGMYAWR